MTILNQIGDRGDWKRIHYDKDLIARINREAEEESRRDKGNKAKTNNLPKQEATIPENANPNQSIINAGDYWTIPNVSYRNGIHTFDLSKTLLENGQAKTQEQWAEYRKIAQPKAEFYTGDMPLYHAVFTALFEQKDNPQFKQIAEEARQFIQNSMRQKCPITLTRIAYQPRGKDKIIHNYKTNEQYELEEKIIGPDRLIESGDCLALKSLLGNGDINKINSVYQWINQTNAYLWRLNEKPKNVDERVARFDASSGGVNLYCYWGPEYADASLGVRLVVRPKGAETKNSGGIK
ncbi:MAG: hypothetical protein WC438_04755 [Candidatus Pacearchaeota archaeon]